MRKILLLAVVVLAAAAFPSSGAAAPRTAALLVAGPVKVHAYRMYLLATPAAKHSSATLIVIFRRENGSDVQEHYYGSTRAVTVRIAADGSSARIRADFGSYGHVNLDFSAGGGGAALPGGCHGASTVSRHSGVVAKLGGLKLDTHSSYFGIVRENSLPASIITVRGVPGCKPKQSQPTHGVTQLGVTVAQPGQGITSFTASHTAKGYISEDVLVIHAPLAPKAPVILDSIVASGLPASDFTFAADLSSAHARGTGSFLSGGLDFMRTLAATPHFAIGTVAGNLTARFDGLGDVRPAAGATSATLSG
jgi:hypothetical protein